MIEQDIAAAEKQCQQANERFHQVKAIHDQAKADQENVGIALQQALNGLARVRGGVLLGNTSQKELTALRKKIIQLRQDMDELPGVVGILSDEMEKARKESSRAQQELDLLKAKRDYPLLRDEIVAAGKSTNETLRALGRLNTLAVKIGRTDEVWRLSKELHEHANGRDFKEPFTFTPDP